MKKYLSKNEELQCGVLIQNMLRMKGTECLDDSFKDMVIQEGEKALALLVEKNSDLAVSQARSYQLKFKTNVPLEDTIQNAQEGLVRAAIKYDPSRGFKFSTMATHWIFQAIVRNGTKMARLIKLPENQAKTLTEINTTRMKYLERGLSASEAHRATQKELGMSEDLYWSIIRATLPSISLDSQEDDDQDSPVKDFPSLDTLPVDITVNNVAFNVLNESLRKLSKEEQLCFVTYYKLDLDGIPRSTYTQLSSVLKMKKPEIVKCALQAREKIMREMEVNKLTYSDFVL